MAADLIAFPIEAAGISEPGVPQQIVAALPDATPSAPGRMSAADKTKLNSVAASATANSSDATLLSRANHTGSQLSSTISDFIAAVRAQVEAALLQGSNITITPAGTGASRTLTIAGLAGGGATDLSYNTGTRLLSSSTGADVTLPLANALTAGLQDTEDYTLVRSAVQPGQNPAATVFAIADSGSVVINPANGALQTWTLGANRTPSASFAEGASCTIHITAGAFTINWATVAVTWLTGAAPVLATSGITPVTLYRVNGTIYGGAPVDLDGLATDLNGLSDVVLSSPATNQVLLFNGTNWVNAAAPGGGGGTVSSVALSAPTGFTVSGSPVTTTGTLAFSFTAGYSLPTTAKQTEWDTAFSQTRQWDGSATGLVAATGRASLGLGTAALSATGDFAPAAQGVTNGNSHDHSGGDGAQIAYSSLSGLPTLGSLAALSALGSITSAGAIGSTANLPIITTTGGALAVGSFGTGANTFCQGNDSRLSDARTPTAHNQTWSTITATPTTLAGYGIADAQPLDSDLTAIAALSTTSFGRSFLALADAAAGRTLLGLGSAATSAASAFAAAIASGTAALGTAAIASGASATVVTVAATGVATTDVIDWGFNANPNSVTGYGAASTTGCLVITAYPTAGNVNFVVSNPTSASITPGALTLNWKVTR